MALPALFPRFYLGLEFPYVLAHGAAQQLSAAVVLRLAILLVRLGASERLHLLARCRSGRRYRIKPD